MSNGAALDMREVFADPQVRPFSRDQRIDLAAANAPTLAEGLFIVLSNKTEKGKIDIVRYIVPYAQERTDVATAQEAFRMLDPQAANGYFAFSPLVNGGPASVNLEVNYNAPRINAGPTNNKDRQIRAGIAHLSADPWIDSQRYNPLFAIPVPSEALFQITFELLPAATGAGIPNPYQIATGAKRVDFAGVVVTGVTMPQTMYDRMLEEEQSRVEK
jgi:hypothetical protein